MKLSELAVRRPVTTAMFIVAIALFGTLAASNLGMELYPDVQLPYITVATIYPNADPQTVETEVTHPVEGVLSTAAGLRRLDSVSMENVSLVFAEFAWGTPLEETINEVRARLAALALTLPAEVQTPIVLRLDPNEFPSLLIGVSGTGDLVETTDIALQVVRPRLERVPGVAQVAVLGGVEREIQVLYDSAKLQAHNLTPAHLQQLLSLQNATVPAGVLEHDGKRWQARVGNHFTSVQEIRDLVIGESRLPVQGLAALWPPLLHVKDVAQVVDGVRPPTGYARMDGRPTVLLQVLKQSGANTVTVADGVRAALRELEREMPDLKLSVIIDQSTRIRQSLESLVVFGLIGAGAVVLVLFGFLRNWRGLLVVALSIPLSILLTLMALYAGRLDLNLMTLGGLAMGTGMVVDNAIIVLENIFRRRSQGEDAATASIRGSQEMTGAIIGATLTTVAVFLPAAFLDSFAGQLFKELGITVSLALAASLIVALTVVPSLAAGLFRGGPMPAGTWDGSRFVLAYSSLLERALARRGLLLALVAVLCLGTGLLVPRLDTEFLPPGYVRVLYVTLELPPGTPLAETDAVARLAEERLLSLPAVAHIAAQVGEQRQEDIVTLLGDYGPHTIQLMAFLEGPASPQERAAVAAAIREALADLPAVRLAVSDQWSSSSSVFSNAIVVQVAGPDLETLGALAAELRQRLDASAAVADVHIPLAAAQPELFLEVNQSRALIGGLTTAQISLAVRNALSGIQVTQVRENGRTIPVVMRPQPSETADLAHLLDHPVTSPVAVPGLDTSAVRLANVVDVQERTAPQAIRRIDGMRAVEVHVRPSGQDLAAALAAVEAAVAALDWPAGYEVRIAGIRQLIDESLADLASVLLWSLVLVFVVLAAQFESWRHPLIIMVTVPLAGIGSVWLLWLTGQKLGVASLIGLIMLGGIAVNNGIVMVDRIHQLCRE
ncbi:MAG: efflux RND transporter permease subunit, partial [Limnochordales bacterium]